MIKEAPYTRESHLAASNRDIENQDAKRFWLNDYSCHHETFVSHLQNVYLRAFQSSDVHPRVFKK